MDLVLPREPYIQSGKDILKKPYQLIRIQKHICLLQRFLKESRFFSEKKPMYFFTKNSECEFFPTNEVNLLQNAKEIVRFH